MEDNNINNKKDSPENNNSKNDNSKNKNTINLTIQEFVILGLCLVLTAVIVACNCIYSVPVAAVQTTYAASSINTTTDAAAKTEDASSGKYMEESADAIGEESTSVKVSSTASVSAKETKTSSETEQTAVRQSVTASSSSTFSGPVNINTADIAALCTLNGIGETKANAIINYRDNNGAFTNIEQLKEVKGIGDATFNKIKDYITVK